MSEIRPYTCTSCHSSFKTESGMLSHVSRQHTGPQLNDTLGRHYSQKLESLQSENAVLRRECDESRTALDASQNTTALYAAMLSKTLDGEAKALVELRKAYGENEKLAAAVGLRDLVLKARLDVTLPNPL